jgi:hypothetical protein
LIKQFLARIYTVVWLAGVARAILLMMSVDPVQAMLG